MSRYQNEDPETFINSLSERTANPQINALISDALQYADFKQYDEWSHAEHPEAQYCVLQHFLDTFPTDEMRDAFADIAAAFLQHEPFLNDPEKRSLVSSLYFPIRCEKRLEDPFLFPVLEMMVLCAQNGSVYSRELLLGLYKTCYKQEYNVLKRYHSLDIGTLEDFLKLDAERNGIPAEARDPEMGYGNENAVMSRLVIMSELMQIELDPVWYAMIDEMNQETIDYHVFWRVMECIQHGDPLRDKRLREYGEYSQKLSQAFPYMDWFFTDERMEDSDDPNQLIALCKHVIEKAMDDRSVNSELFMEDYRFDLRDSAVNALMDFVGQIDPAEEPEKVIFLAVIRFLAEVIAALEVQREKELQILLRFQYEDLVTDDMLREAGMDDETLDRFTKWQDSESIHDPQLDKVLRRAQEAAGKAAKRKNMHSAAEAPARESRRVDENGAKHGEAAEADGLAAQIEEKNRQIAQLKGKLNQQHALLAESQKREISLRAHMDDWKRDQAELIRLREFVHNLESDDYADDTPATGEMIACLNTKKVIIIGGHENWIKKMRRLFPHWEYITGKSGLRVEGAVQSCDKIYFYTDICGHSLYYRFLAAAAEYKKPYAFLHGTNPDRVVRYIYDDLTVS